MLSMSMKLWSLENLMSEYQAAFFIVPARILNLPDISLAYLRIYETIFQFWNHGKACFLSNQAIRERAGNLSHGTLMQAFTYFEKHNELQRITKDGQRYLIEPRKFIKLENDLPVDKGVTGMTGGGHWNDREGVTGMTHNTKNSNSKNINKSSYAKEDQKKANEKKHDFASNMNEIASEKKHIEEHQRLKSCAVSDETKALCHELALKLKRASYG